MDDRDLRLYGWVHGFGCELRMDSLHVIKHFGGRAEKTGIRYCFIMLINRATTHKSVDAGVNVGGRFGLILYQLSYTTTPLNILQ